ncbi:MAG: glutamine--fructose-6-phosphate transaminase (isomerizing) [Nitrospiraceae bacterium]|nr:glutamine--fructose-6-phosphate transaminase (isomerizing) [Nitrospiraceae bacterium]
MCGIVGYLGKRSAVEVLIGGLERLEYRGYDSAGVAFVNGAGVEIKKTCGRIIDLSNMFPPPYPKARLGLGHTRWATHGAPSDKNAHPHQAGSVVVVHNGIIENHDDLRMTLSSQGHQFQSETDTEVICQLLYKFVKEGMLPKEALKHALPMLKGSYAIGAIFSDEEDRIYAARNGSPLVLGIGQGEYFFASDIPAFLKYTKNFIFLEDGDLCAITQSGYEIEQIPSNTDKKGAAQRKIVEIGWSAEMAEKEGHGHFMHKEIHEQPAAVKNTIGEWTGKPGKLLDAFGLAAKYVLSIERLQFVACGTSYYAALVGKRIIEDLAHIPVDVEIASEYRYKTHFIDKETCFVSITQSGETADTLAAQREAARKGAKTLTICNVVGSTASRESGSVFYTKAGPEMGVASTKTFTAQVASLAMLAAVLGMKRGRISSGEAGNFLNQLAMIPELMDKALLLDGPMMELATVLRNSGNFLYLGRGISYPVALEGALKLKEISYVHAEGYPAGEMKHGPIALLEKGMPVVLIAPADALIEKTLSNMEEVKARGARIIAITDEPAAFRAKADDIVAVPSTHPSLSPFMSVLPLQFLAYHVGVLKGCDVDRPRNLAKSVTVE